MLEFAAMAQAFVEATSPLVGGRILNIMNRQGIIIASTEKDRIGSFHQGAAEVIATGKPVLIEKKDIDRYPGAKEGYNMPIFLDDEIIGVVGIFGCEEQMLNVANLLSVYVAQHFAQQAMARKQTVESELRNRLLHLLLSGDRSQIETISQLSAVLPVTLTFPLKVIRIEHRPDAENTAHINRYSQLIHRLVLERSLRPLKDVFGIWNNSCVILHSLPEKGRTDNSLSRLLKALKGDTALQAAISDPCEKLEDLPSAMGEVNALNSMEGERISDLSDRSTRIRFLVYKSFLHGGERYARILYQKLLQDQEPQQAEILLVTAQTYYEEKGSVHRAAERLHLHKNTLLYRMKRLFSLLDLEEEDPFTREYLIRMILIFHPVKHIL